LSMTAKPLETSSRKLNIGSVWEHLTKDEKEYLLDALEYHLDLKEGMLDMATLPFIKIDDAINVCNRDMGIFIAKKEKSVYWQRANETLKKLK